MSLPQRKASTPPTILGIKRKNGVAGNYAYTVHLAYPGDQEPATQPTMVTLHSNLFTNSVTLEAGGQQVRVINTERYGPDLNPTWIRNFFGPQ